MVADFPSNNSDNKMDMKVWMNSDGIIMHQHFEKPMSSKHVQTQEILRRLFKSSRRLSWKENAAPVLTEYMTCMMIAGYPEKYRKYALCRALRIYDKMVEDDLNGHRPLYSPTDFGRIPRRVEKQKKRNNSSNRFVPLPPPMVSWLEN